MKRFITAAFTLVGLVFAMGCVGAPDSDSEGSATDEAPTLEAQAPKPCPFPPKMPICVGGTIRCEFDGTHCGGECKCYYN